MLDKHHLKKKSQEELINLLFNSEQQVKELQLKLDMLLASKYKKKSEQFDGATQLEIQFDEPSISQEEETVVEKAEVEISVPAHKRKKKKGRKPLPKELTRKAIIHDLSDENKLCGCGCIKKCIGEEVSEKLEYIPAETYVERHIRKKYACNKCDAGKIEVAKAPLYPIPKSIAAPGLLAQILASKYSYHLPLYRQEEILQDAGVDIPRATTSSWVIKCATLLQPLVNLLQDNITSYDVSYADETRMQVLKEQGREASQQSFVWCFAGGESNKFSIVLRYSKTRNHTVPLEFFGDSYSGYLHCDGYSGYNAMAKVNKATLVGCVLHARRKFFDITKTTKNKGLSHEAIKVFGHLAKIEHQIKDKQLSYQECKEFRYKHSKPILDKFKTWLTTNINLVPPKFPIGQAIKYTLNQWPKLIKYLDDGRLEWSNNLSERIMKLFATGRKNWMFSNSVQGAEASAVIYSLVATCKHHDINLFKYFRHVLKHIPSCKTAVELESLLPYNIKLKD